VIEQERAMVDGPDSILHSNASQRSFTLKGFERMGFDLRHIAERYQQAFGEDYDKLIQDFDSMKEVRDASCALGVWLEAVLGRSASDCASMDEGLHAWTRTRLTPSPPPPVRPLFAAAEAQPVGHSHRHRQEPRGCLHQACRGGGQGGRARPP
jgi:hypothetical protein